MRNMRSQDIADISGVRFHIVGCGAIGSSVATQLARLGADNFTLYDYDKVGIENVGVSQYVYQDIGKTKIEALYRHLTKIDHFIKVNRIPKFKSLDYFYKFFKKFNYKKHILKEIKKNLI